MKSWAECIELDIEGGSSCRAMTRTAWYHRLDAADKQQTTKSLMTPKRRSCRHVF